VKAAIYARVSTFDQEPENQLQELRRYVSARGEAPDAHTRGDRRVRAGTHPGAGHGGSTTDEDARTTARAPSCRRSYRSRPQRIAWGGHWIGFFRMAPVDEILLFRKCVADLVPHADEYQRSGASLLQLHIGDA